MLGATGVEAAPLTACPTDASAPAETPLVRLSTEAGPAYGSMQYAHQAVGLKPRQVALTFDDGPDPATTPSILAILKKHCIKATYFLVGIYAEKRPDLVRAIAAQGHIIGTHSYTHPNLRRLSTSRAHREIRKGFEAAQAALASAPPEDRARLAPFFRFPGLNDKKSLIRWLGERNVATISCDFGADDWKHISADQVYQRALRNINSRGQGIIILHDTKPHTADMLERLIMRMRQQGYEFVQLAPDAHARRLATQVPGALLDAVPVTAGLRPSQTAEVKIPSLEPAKPIR